MASADNNSIQGSQLSKWAIAAWCAGLLAVVFILGYFLISFATWLRRPPAPKPMHPIPVVVKQEFVQNLLTANEMKVTIRNDGVVGLVNIEIYKLLDVGGELTKGESGVEKSIRETFTRDLEPNAKYIPKYQRFGYGSANVELQVRETKTISISLQGYNWANSISGDKLYVDATGVVPRAGGK
ncbi:MAG: hypothetical protein JWP89_3376 [Schlesneria sp.]|nr:hypothetical protein [Schlesneria sp.]